MSNSDIDVQKNEFLINRIEKWDTLSDFVDKCNANFDSLFEMGGGPTGATGKQGDIGNPTKPKVPIHIWIKHTDYDYENENENGFEINTIYANLSENKYQEGHLIMLQNAHVYILKIDPDTFELAPEFVFVMQSYNPGDVIDGKNAYLHIAYSNSSDGTKDFITNQDLNANKPPTTFNLKRSGESSDDNLIENSYTYIGVYSNNEQSSSLNPSYYTWVRLQGQQGLTGAVGPKGDKGDKGDTGPTGPAGPAGDNYTGHLYAIDLEGDMSTFSLNANRNIAYDGDYCECIAHAYYGKENVKLNTNQVSIKSLSDGYIIQKDDENKIHIQYDGSYVGSITITQKDNDVTFRFTPDSNFLFPKNDIIFSIHVEADIYDENNSTTYSFTRDNVWVIKGIVSTFELEIIPQYRTIKLFDDGRYPEELSVSVYKTENGEREIFDFSKNPNFKLLYKNYDDDDIYWTEYTRAVNTNNVSCLEFKVVKNHKTENEELWDYEDVWAVADGKSIHYYHADLGNTESMMVLTTGEKINISEDGEEPKYCADIINKDGYSITFNPKFYDGSEELEVTSVDIGPNSGEIYYSNGTFVRELVDETINGVKKYILKITRVPYGVEVIPMTIIVTAETTEGEIKSDSISFNVYISTQSNIYTLVPTKPSYNTSTGKSGDKIGCSVYKNNVQIPITDLQVNGLTLKYGVYNGKDDIKLKNYTEPIVYGTDDDNIKDEFAASDVAIEFILYYLSNEIVRSTVPLIKDGIDGKDGDSWQYIFCRSSKYPFNLTGISNPENWTEDPNPNDNNSEYLGNKENGFVANSDKNWYDDHKGVSKEFKYEYQAYRKWNKENKCWGKYGEPTLYSNYSEDGSGYTAILSNPVAVIPVGDDDWRVNENMLNQKDSTMVYLYNNTSNISNITITLPEDNEYVKNGNFKVSTNENDIQEVIFTPVVGDIIFDFKSNSQYKLPITITYSLGVDSNGDGITDHFSTTLNWTLSPIKGLEDVEVFVDKRIVNITETYEHTFKVGYYLTSNTSRKFIESSDPEKGNIKNYSIVLTPNVFGSGSDKLNNFVVVDDWANANFNFTNYGGVNNFYVVLLDSDGNIIDYVNVSAIKDGVDPSCVSVEILGYSLTEIDIDSKEWVSSLDDLYIDSEQTSIGQKIYILYEYTWSDGNRTKGITVTLSGTQGIEGKSRVLFYLGSFEEGKATLSGDSIMGHLTPERCDYYIDVNGKAWMRIGQEDKDNGDVGVVGSKYGNSNNDNWQESEKVGFLQAGAITADMINVKNLVTSDAFVNNLTVTNANISETLAADKIDVDNLKVKAANITGTLTIGSDSENGVSLKGTLSSDNISDGAITTTKIKDGAIETGKIAASAITADKIAASAIEAFEIDASQIKTGIINAGRIDVDNLSVKKLNTNPSSDSGRVRIQDNEIIVTENNSSKPVLKISGNSIADDFANTSAIADRTITFAEGSFSFASNLQDFGMYGSNKTKRVIPLNGVYWYNSPIVIPNSDEEIYSRTKIYFDSNDNMVSDTINCTFTISNHSAVNGMASAGGFNVGIQCIVFEKNSSNTYKSPVASFEYKKLLAKNSIYIQDGLFYEDRFAVGSTGKKTIYIDIPFDTICDNKYADDKYIIGLFLVISDIVDIGNELLKINYKVTSGNSIEYKMKSLVSNMPNVNIYKDSFRYFIDDYNYLNIDDEGYFTYYGPGMISGFGVNKDDGVWFNVGGQKFKLSDLSTDMANAVREINENANKYQTVSTQYNTAYSIIDGIKVDLYGEGGTAGAPIEGSVLSRTKSIEVGLYGEGGTAGAPIKDSVAYKAQIALTTAGTANSNASSALTTANAAKTNANTANTNASSALTTANAAQSTANAANTNASSALTTANAAQSTANTNRTAVNNLTDMVNGLNVNVINLNTSVSKIQHLSTSSWLTAAISSASSTKSINLSLVSAGASPRAIAIPYKKTSGTQYKLYYDAIESTINIYSGGDISKNTYLAFGTTTFTDSDENCTVIEPIDDLIEIKTSNTIEGITVEKITRYSCLGLYTSTDNNFTINVKVTNSDGASCIQSLTIKIMS